MSLIGNIGLASNVVSLASGQIPFSFGFRLLPMFFGRKKGLTKAQMKKMMMRKRQMFVSNVIMHHKRLHDQNREQIIEKTKAKISRKSTKKVLGAPSRQPQTTISKLTPQKEQGNRLIAKPLKPKQEPQRKTSIQGLIDNERQKSRSKWAVKVKDNSKSSQEI